MSTVDHELLKDCYREAFDVWLQATSDILYDGGNVPKKEQTGEVVAALTPLTIKIYHKRIGYKSRIRHIGIVDFL